MAEKKHDNAAADVKGQDIIVEDANLNEDPEALHRFLLEQVETNKPVLRLRIDGSEVTNHTGWVCTLTPCSSAPRLTQMTE
jgi:hypothetical protein